MKATRIRAVQMVRRIRDRNSRILAGKTTSEIISVKFTQSADRCYLEITTTEGLNDYLLDETTKRTDLAFIAGGTGSDDRFFSPANSVIENVHRFVSDFDEISIINCTDLFTPEAARRIDELAGVRRTPNPA